MWRILFGGLEVFMKKRCGIFVRLFFVAAAVAAAISFAACSADDFSDALAWYRDDDSGLGSITLAFYEDGSFVLHKYQKSEEKTGDGKVIYNDYDVAAGTYTGTPTEDGSVTVTYSRYADMTGGGGIGARWLFGEKKVTYGNDRYPLIEIKDADGNASPVTVTYSISSGKIDWTKSGPTSVIPLELPSGEKLVLKKGDSGIKRD